MNPKPSKAKKTKANYFIASQAFQKGKPGKITVTWNKEAIPPAKGKGWEKEFEELMSDNNLVSAINGEDFMKDKESLKDFIAFLLSQAYEEGRRGAIEAAKAIFAKHKEEPMTGNVVLLELEVMLGAFNYCANKK